jgi:putative Mn2+ efflux pump MntP
MELITLLLLALCLAADAFAVSVSDGIYSNKVTKMNAISTACIFGFCQGFMPVLGFFLGRTFTEVISRFHHWIALFLLGAIGINLLSEAIKEWKNPEEFCAQKNIFSIKNLIMQGIATSIDALAAGVSFAVLEVNIFAAAFLISVITFICCGLGVVIGKKFGSILGLRARLLGGTMLIVIGLKLFIEHQF